ncbi:hypothetical protein [Oceanirhabdus sp. W0125-5]|uniref:hypothetical protein n=1 Tax=Oceanirhabdus sp. W0125-5 TaxID=2999116 RepID=UPI0022F2DDB7|nr:hypothetical protein [Oceanirhabdus sp. W0125-5]WBW99313.1 hypothetical protein OW730_11350 [Oceanirhabdus sp. W0125-5]
MSKKIKLLVLLIPLLVFFSTLLMINFFDKNPQKYKNSDDVNLLDEKTRTKIIKKYGLNTPSNNKLSNTTSDIGYSYNNKSKHKSSSENKETNSSKGNAIIENKEINFLFYDEVSNNKIINLTFNRHFDGQRVERIDLFQNDVFVTDRVSLTINSISGNKLIIVLNEYVEEFNSICIYNSNNEPIFLNVGQYNFEKYNKNDFVSHEDTFKLTSFHTKDMLNSFEGVFEIIGSGDYQIKTYIPKKLKDMNILKEVISTSDNEYVYKCSIDKEYYYKNNLKTINFETLFYHVSNENIDIKYKFLEINIILEI